MELKDLSLFSKDLIAINSPEGNKDLIEGAEVDFFEDSGQWFIRQGEFIKPVKPFRNEGFFYGLAERKETIWLVSKKTSKQAFLQYISASEILSISMPIGIDTLVLEFLYNEMEIKERDMTLASQWLLEEFVIDGNKQRLVVTRFQEAGDKDFQILGRTWRADIQPVKDGGFLIRRIARKTQKPPSIKVLAGNFQFSDVSSASKLQDPSQQAMLESALHNTTAYMDLWKLYNDLEWKRAQGAASKLGALRYVDCKGIEMDGGNAWRLIPKSMEAFNKFKELWRQLEIPFSAQVEVSDQEPDWTSELIGGGEQEKVVRGVITFDKQSIIVRPDTRRRNNKPSRKGYIYYSLAGERTIGKRREEAKRTIDSGKYTPQRHLRYLLEGVSVPVDRRKKLKDVTTYSKETFKGGTPTDRQRRALSVALNTPDIALIIGPPGTGKTQVIAALQRRLAEESKGRKLRGQVLISSYQHDAVDNALGRSDVFGLPPVRVGGRQGSSAVSIQFEHWSTNLAGHLDQQVEELERREPLLSIVKALYRQFQLLRMARLDLSGRVAALQKADQLLEEIQTAGTHIPALLQARWQEYLESQGEITHKTKSEPDRKKLLASIRALRVKEATFADDGGDRAYSLSRSLRREGIEIDEEFQMVLDKAADGKPVDKSDLKKLDILRDLLIDRIMPDYRPPEVRSSIDGDGLALISDLEQALERTITSSRKGIAGVLEQLSNALHFDPQQAQNTTEEYAMVIGATCQQSAGNQMSNLKDVAGLDDTSITFDTVVVDEAARANPLDLFIPMSMSERRIVLVGDDRQLPHLLVQEIEQEVASQNSLNEIERKAFESSLFERLRNKLQRLEKEDGIPRVVMLNKQFRMHPVLGDFVSQNFYESVGLEPVESGRKAEEFSHQLPGYEGKVCAWVDVPRELGAERRSDTSLGREVEAERIAREAAQLLKTTDGNISVGVITFYSAQTKLIMEELEGLGIMQKTAEGFQPVEKYKSTNNGEERIRVGSVDAFQGKEFDVVLLSCVRTSGKRAVAHAEDGEQREAQLNRKYGFLRLVNRMNVAMSRQRKLLVIVGDSALAEGEEAREAVPALVAFADMCRGTYGCIR